MHCSFREKGLFYVVIPVPLPVEQRKEDAVFGWRCVPLRHLEARFWKQRQGKHAINRFFTSTSFHLLLYVCSI